MNETPRTLAGLAAQAEDLALEAIKWLSDGPLTTAEHRALRSLLRAIDGVQLAVGDSSLRHQVPSLVPARVKGKPDTPIPVRPDALVEEVFGSQLRRDVLMPVVRALKAIGIEKGWYQGYNDAKPTIAQFRAMPYATLFRGGNRGVTPRVELAWKQAMTTLDVQLRYGPEGVPWPQLGGVVEQSPPSGSLSDEGRATSEETDPMPTRLSGDSVGRDLGGLT